MTNRRKEPTRKGNVVRVERGLVPDMEWASAFDSRQMGLMLTIRRELARHTAGLAEKVNTKGLYFGYRNGRGFDALYIHVQKKNLVISVRLSRAHVGHLRAEGYKVNARPCHQYRAGWLTGWEVPHDDREPLKAVRWMLAALEHDAPVKLAKPPSAIT